MRILLKVLLFPVILILTIIVGIARLICTISNGILGLISSIIFIIALCTVILLQEPIWTGLQIALVGWLISPWGLPLIVTFLGEVLGGVKDMLREI